MSHQDLVSQALAAWAEYGRTLCDAYHFPPGSRIVAGPRLETLRQIDEADLRHFIAHVRSQTDAVCRPTLVSRAGIPAGGRRTRPDG